MQDIRPRPHLEWEYQPEEPQPPEDKSESVRSIVRDIFIFFFYLVVGFAIVFLPTLFIVGEFLDPIPSTLKAIKISAIFGGVLVIVSIFIFWKRKIICGVALLLGAVLAIALYSVGYYYYLNGQTTPLFEGILSFFSL